MAKKMTVYVCNKKKRGFGRSYGSYGTIKKGDKFFILTNIRTGKTRSYESVRAAMNDGWSKE
jgi:hypothetical protein